MVSKETRKAGKVRWWDAGGRLDYRSPTLRAMETEQKKQRGRAARKQSSKKRRTSHNSDYIKKQPHSGLMAC